MAAPHARAVRWIGTFMSRFPRSHGQGPPPTPRDVIGSRLVRRLPIGRPVKTRLGLLPLVALLAIAGAACGSDPLPVPTPQETCGSGLICTWAGNGDPAFYGDGLDRREAMLYWPMDLAF